MRKLSFMDSVFLRGESRETPMHVGVVNLFTLPRGADETTFLHHLADNLRSAQEFQPLFSDRLVTGPLGMLGPLAWDTDDSLDLDYHIRHSALPRPGRYRELFALVSRLHATLLDRKRPLWEMHLIEGLQQRRFAVYSKYHHAAIDGVRAIHLTQSMFSTSARARLHESPLSREAMEHYRDTLPDQAPPEYSNEELRNVADVLKQRYDSGVQVYGALQRFSEAWMGRGGALALPWLDVPRSAINTTVDGARRFVAQSWPFDRIRGVGKAMDGTFNDAVLAMCAGALRLYLLNHGELPRQSLKTMVPVSLRQAGDIDSSNAVGAISADLATNIKDPVKRFNAIKASMQAGKAMFEGMNRKEAELAMQLTQMPGLFVIPLGLISRFPPYSTVISNVPGPRQPMYWDGARLDGIYPASIVSEGVALNITLISYDKKVDFGITACRRTMPQVQRLIDYMEQSLVELEDAAGLASVGGKRKARRKQKRATGKKTPVAARRAKAKLK
jgi:diacylglycerol O-acyltransferase